MIQQWIPCCNGGDEALNTFVACSVRLPGKKGKPWNHQYVLETC